ncbi:cytochrome c biogenesis CcdA family protein [Cryobacterium zhongshanensis]|uniref:Cytochrome c biogenesis protein CcdA n=1 Tax=Cryobacterium zhongshanensis TaxID=2928153 RepID=A0AA41QVF3_9MICO|nr:cytochrome c biogenesis protein CcdA [Cryobacterium zhongshanensis]MCI4658472.1 cytochrome c biogenesis protein CcdA [Cryobacterium zhongshanensis]
MGENFAQIILSGQLIIAIPIALLAGFVSFASPCVLPLIPGYLAYVGGMVGPDIAHPRRRVLAGVGLFVLGFAVVFVSYGAAFGAAGYWLVRWQDPITRVLGLVLVVMGLAFIGAFSFFQRTMKPRFTPATGLAGAPMLGVVFGIGWTPCLGPTLTAISLLSLDSGSPWRGALLGLAYCIGLGVPFLLVALGLNWMAEAVSWLKRHIRAINIVGGSMLILIGALMVSGVWTLWVYSLQSMIGGFLLPI